MMQDVFDVREFGAVGDGLSVDTSTIQRAIDQCFTAGGGVVGFVSGTYVTGTNMLKSNVYLQIQPSATLLASPSITDYSNQTHYNRYSNETEMDKCLIYAEDATNIGIVGQGEIDGNAECFFE